MNEFEMSSKPGGEALTVPGKEKYAAMFRGNEGAEVAVISESLENAGSEFASKFGDYAEVIQESLLENGINPVDMAPLSHEQEARLTGLLLSALELHKNTLGLDRYHRAPESHKAGILEKVKSLVKNEVGRLRYLEKEKGVVIGRFEGSGFVESGEGKLNLDFGEFTPYILEGLRRSNINPENNSLTVVQRQALNGLISSALERHKDAFKKDKDGNYKPEVVSNVIKLAQNEVGRMRFLETQARG